MRRGAGGSSAELPPDDELEAGQPGAEPSLGRIFRSARQEWAWLFLGCVFLLLSLAPSMMMPIYFGKILDDIDLKDPDTGQLRPVAERRSAVNLHALELVGLLGFGAVATLGRAFVFNSAGERVVARLRITLFRAIIKQEIAMFDKRKTGELLSRLTADTTSLQDVATTNISMFVRSIVQIIASIGLMFITSPSLTLLVLAVVPPCALAIMAYSRIIKRLSTKYSDALGRASDVAQQSVANVRTVRSFAAEQVESCKYEAAVGNPDSADDRKCCWYPRQASSYKAGIQKSVAGSAFIAFATTVGLTAITAVIWYGALEVISGKITHGNLITFILYAVQIGGSLSMVSGLVVSLFQAKGAAKRTFQLIDRDPKVPVSGGLVPDHMEGVIRFEGVSFHYPSRPDVMVLRDFTLDIQKNATVAFVGSSGAGKSTVLSLIQRFYDVTGGQIYIDGHPLTSLDPSWVRRHFAFVQQEPALFGASIAENIAYGHAVQAGSPSAVPPQERVESAARDAYAHDFIMSFPEGYETLVGERGVRLSGGQKQRVAIARALLMDPRVLLLDEATSALDAESESIVARAIQKAMVGRTTLIVAHRLSTVQNADQIVVVDHGSIVDTGTHDQLLGRCAKYQDLVRRQLTGSAPPASAEDLVDEGVRGDHLAFNAHLHSRLAGQRFVPVHGEDGCYVAFTNATCREVMNDCATFSSNPFPDNRLVALNTMSKADHARVLRAVHGFYQAAEVGRLEARITAVVERCTEELARDGAGDAMAWAKRIHMTSTLARLGVEWSAQDPWDRVDEVVRLNDAMVALVAPLGGIGLRYHTLPTFYLLWVLLGMVQSILPLLMMTYRFGIACTWEIIRPDTTLLFPASRPRMGLWWRPELLPLVPRYFLALHELLVDPRAADGGAIAGIREAVAAGTLRLPEALTLLVQLMVNMTSANALGNMLFRLASEKEAAEEVASDLEGLAEAFVEEVLRLDAPLQRNPRRVVADPRGRWKDTPLRQGDQVLCFLGAANMDPAAFERPTEFLLRRGGGKPGALSFGSGIHYCLGSSIVRLEMKLALQCLLRNYKDVQVESHSRLVDVDVGNWGFSRLRVRLGRRDA